MMVRTGKIAGNECIVEKYQRPSRIFIFETAFYWGKPISGQDTLTITRLVRTLNNHPIGENTNNHPIGENTNGGNNKPQTPNNKHQTINPKPQTPNKKTLPLQIKKHLQ